MHGWKPRAAERMMSWRSVTMTKANVDAYLARYVKNGDVVPFDYRRMSKVLASDRLGSAGGTVPDGYRP